MEVPVSIMKFLLQTQGSFGGLFCLKCYIFWWFLGECDFQSSFVWFLGDKIRNSNVFLWMCFRMCFREYVSNLHFRPNHSCQARVWNTQSILGELLLVGYWKHSIEIFKTWLLQLRTGFTSWTKTFPAPCAK